MRDEGNQVQQARVAESHRTAQRSKVSVRELAGRSAAMVGAYPRPCVQVLFVSHGGGRISIARVWEIKVRITHWRSDGTPGARQFYGHQQENMENTVVPENVESVLDNEFWTKMSRRTG